MSTHQGPVTSFPLGHIQRITDLLSEKNLENGPYSIELEEADQVSVVLTVRLPQPDQENVHVVYSLLWDDAEDTWIVSLFEETER